MSPGSKTTVDITMSLDGFVAGPNPTIESPLGVGGERLHEWVYNLDSWRQRHGLTGGERNADAELVEEGVAATGAVIMGRRMFSGGSGPWEDDPVADGWWGDDPPFGVPVFILTHHPRETVTKEGGTTFTFVTDGIEAALEQARAAAGDRNVARCRRGERRPAVPERRRAGRDPDPRRADPARQRHPALRRPRRQIGRGSRSRG